VGTFWKPGGSQCRVLDRGGKGSRTVSGLSFARIAVGERTRGDEGYRSPENGTGQEGDERGGFVFGKVKVLHGPDMGSPSSSAKAAGVLSVASLCLNHKQRSHP